jgi:hypothetical protein
MRLLKCLFMIHSHSTAKGEREKDGRKTFKQLNKIQINHYNQLPRRYVEQVIINLSYVYHTVDVRSGLQGPIAIIRGSIHIIGVR